MQERSIRDRGADDQSVVSCYLSLLPETCHHDRNSHTLLVIAKVVSKVQYVNRVKQSVPTMIYTKRISAGLMSVQ